MSGIWPKTSSWHTMGSMCVDLIRDVPVIYRKLPLRVPLTTTTVLPLVCWHPNWKSRIISSLLRRTPGDFLDVGANIGQTLCDYLYTGLPYRYWAFEPNRECVDILSSIIRRNMLRNCRVLDFGLADTETRGKLLLTPGSRTDTRATICPGLRPGRRCGVQEVRLRPLDVVRSEFSITKVGLIKLDVEGAELCALQGMAATLSTDRPHVLCEVLLRDKTASESEYRSHIVDLMKLLSDLEYDVSRVGKAGLRARLPATRVTAFPENNWSIFRAGQCDYVFTPREQAASRPYLGSPDRDRIPQARS